MIENITRSEYGQSISTLPQYVTFEAFFKFGIIYFFIVWITMIMWVTIDVTSRSSSIMLQFTSILMTIVLGPLGLLLYLIVRPRSAVHSKFIQEIEHNLSVLSHIVENGKKGLLFCPNCSKKISHVSKVCTKCKENLQKICNNCDKIVLLSWKSCPYCQKKIKHTKKKS